MKVLIFSDVHGNLPAFEKMLKTVGDCDEYICLGDMVNYGPWSNECVDLALSIPNIVLIKGNHEDAFIHGFYPGENVLVNTFFKKCYQSFNKVEEIKKFISEYRLNGFICKHTIQDKYIYPDTEINLDSDYIIGHSHHQFRLANNSHTLYNTGSVGQNRKVINRAEYIILDSEKMLFSFHSIPYDLDLMINEMRARKYEEDCIQYYLKKQRSSS